MGIHLPKSIRGSYEGKPCTFERMEGSDFWRAWIDGETIPKRVHGTKGSYAVKTRMVGRGMVLKYLAKGELHIPVQNEREHTVIVEDAA